MSNSMIKNDAMDTELPMISMAYTEALKAAREKLLDEEFRGLQSREEAKRLFAKFKIAYASNAGNAGQLYIDVRDILLKNLDCFRSEYSDNTGWYDYPFSNQKHAEEVTSKLGVYIEKLRTGRELDAYFLELLYKNYTLYKTSAEYMTRLVRNRLAEIGSQDLLKEDTSTGLLIMKQFIKQFQDGFINYKQKDRKICIKDRGIGEKKSSDDYSCVAISRLCKEKYSSSYDKMSKELTEDDFEYLLNLSDEETCNFAKIADWFSKGKFGRQGKTREYIYVFAIAFEMDAPLILREALSNELEITEGTASEWGDINKRLFFDFYTDNLLDVRTREDEIFIDGYGINWKNFEEVIFIYFIMRSDMTAKMKLYKALEKIRRCHKSGVTETTDARVVGTSLDQKFQEEGTKYLLTNSYIKSVFCLNEDDFEKYVKKNYICRSDEGNNGTAVLYASERKTASEIYDNLTRYRGRDVIISLDLESTPENGFVLAPDRDIKVSVDSNFARCITKFMDRYIDGDWANGLPYVSRASLIAAIAHFIIVTPNLRESEATESFKSFYNYFCSDVAVRTGAKDNEIIYHGANAILNSCGYCEISDKSIFDMLILYVTYRSCVTQNKKKEV